jgi:hypothetical protein
MRFKEKNLSFYLTKMWFESAWDLQMGSHHETCLGTNWPLRCLRSLERSGWVFGGNCVVNGKLWQVMASYYPNPQIVINCNGNPNVSHLSHLIILPHLVNSLPGVGPPSMLFTSFLAVGNCGCSSPNVVFQCILQGLIHPQISYIYITLLPWLNLVAVLVKFVKSALPTWLQLKCSRCDGDSHGMFIWKRKHVDIVKSYNDCRDSIFTNLFLVLWEEPWTNAGTVNPAPKQ